MSDSIGLAMGTVKLVSYDPSWQSHFEAEAKLLQQKLGINASRVQHLAKNRSQYTSGKQDFIRSVLNRG